MVTFGNDGTMHVFVKGESGDRHQLLTALEFIETRLTSGLECFVRRSPSINEQTDFHGYASRFHGAFRVTIKNQPGVAINQVETIMKHTGVRIPGYRLDKTGKPVKADGRKSVSQRIREKKSKKVRVGKR